MIAELSVLIPIFNCNITALVTDLLEQCRNQNCRFEILLIDDASEEQFRLIHRALNEHPEIRYIELRQNIGRAAIRNLLAQESKFSWLLFLDNDSALPDADFIKRYLINPESSQVLVGGTIYEKNLPAEKFALRWNYGREREEIKAHKRNQNPHQKLTLNNIFIQKEVYLKYPLETNLPNDYGHEDTKFGWSLSEAGIPVTHLNNPVVHLGLETADEFLFKTAQAVENLYQFFISGKANEGSKLINSYLLLKKARAVKTYLNLFRKLEPSILLNLKSCKPNLFYFDLYKLFLFSELAAKKQNK